MAEELGIDSMWKNLAYRNATKEDEERIQSALDSEEAIPANADWAVKLGINLFYSANLSRAPLYSKQMPYNSVIYYAFGRSSLAGSPIEPKVYQRRSSNQKKVVAGKWCGKVWMSSQVHPLLAKRDYEDGDEKSLHGWSPADKKIERSEGGHKNNFNVRKSGSKRKMTVESGGSRKANISEREYVDSDNSIEDKYNQQQRTIPRSKKARYVERDDAASEGDYSPLQHYGKSVSKHSKCIGSSAVSDDFLDDDSHMQYGRNFKVPKSTDSDVFSDDTTGYDSDWQLRGEHSSKQIQDSERDQISEDSMSGDSPRLHKKIRKSNQAKYEEDVISDDQMEDHFQKQQRRIPKSRQDEYLSGEDMVSDDQLEQHTQKQQRRVPKSRQAQYLAGEDITSDDQLEDHTQKYRRRICKSNQAKCLVEEDVMSDDQMEDHIQKQRRSVPRRQNKRMDKVMVDSTDNHSHLLHRTPKRKQAKSMDEDNINSDDQMEDSSHQPQRRILRSKQAKSEPHLGRKKSNACRVKEPTSQPVKQGSRLLTKPKASQKMKQPPRGRKNQPNNCRDFDLGIEEDGEGGPSTRLRKRVPKAEESEAKPKEKQTNRKKVNNASAVKVSAGHAKFKDEDGEYACDIEGCTMSFSSKQELAVHKRNVCPVKGCGKKFFSHKYLVQHRRVHVDDRPLRCPWKGCKMTFKWAWARTEHIRVHTGARPYSCAEPGCGQTFRFVSDFSRHKRKTGHSAKKNR